MSRLSSPEDVRDALREFIRELHEWEILAYSRVDDLSDESCDLVKETFFRVIARHCVSGSYPVNVSASKDPNHHSQNEILVSASLNGKEWILHTRISRKKREDVNYRYEMTRIGEKWMVLNYSQILRDGSRIEYLVRSHSNQ